MGWVKIAFGSIFTLVVLLLLAVYWFMPFGPSYFRLSGSGDSNFSISSGNLSGMQFYQNMRYTSSSISYYINKTACNLQRQNDMERALARIENVTVLRFYPSDSNPEIYITCNNTILTTNQDFFIAGEGGVVNVTPSGEFNVIRKGEVLLLKNSDCSEPNIATHELLHALGFQHSHNPNNIMYPTHTCFQTIGQDIPQLINSLYSYPSLPDLSLKDASVYLHGKYLNANATVMNDGLATSQKATLVISANGKVLKEESIEPIPLGSGITYGFTNVFVPLMSVNSIEFNIQTSQAELQKNNNEIKLAVG